MILIGYLRARGEMYKPEQLARAEANLKATELIQWTPKLKEEHNFKKWLQFKISKCLLFVFLPKQSVVTHDVQR